MDISRVLNGRNNLNQIPMNLELNKEQESYIKSLDTSKAKKEFFLSAIIANICDSTSKKVTDMPSKTLDNDVFYGFDNKPNDEPLYTKEYFLQELEKAFNASREVIQFAVPQNTGGYGGNVGIGHNIKYHTFNDYLNALKND
jgi:hypothetical protein